MSSASYRHDNGEYNSLVETKMQHMLDNLQQQSGLWVPCATVPTRDTGHTVGFGIRSTGHTSGDGLEN